MLSFSLYSKKKELFRTLFILLNFLNFPPTPAALGNRKHQREIVLHIQSSQEKIPILRHQLEELYSSFWI